MTAADSAQLRSYLSVELLCDWIVVLAILAAVGGGLAAGRATYWMLDSDVPHSVSLAAAGVAAAVGAGVAPVPLMIANAVLRLLRDVAIAVDTPRPYDAPSG